MLTRHGDADRVVETYEYDTSGRKTKTLHVDVAAQRSDTTYAWGVEGTDTAYSAQGTASLTTTYNERDQPARLSFRNLAGGELSRVEFRYDDAGRLVEEVQRNVQDFLPRERLTSLSPAELKAVQEFLGAGTELTRCTHVYDEQGRRVETCSIIGPLGCDRTAVTFNQYGDPIVSVTEDETNDFEVDEQGRLVDNPSRKTVRHSETRFRYEYDSEGNWLSKVVESRPSGEDEFSVSTIEQRTITYFV